MTDKRDTFPVRPMSRQEWDQAPESARPRAEVWLRQKRDFEVHLKRWRREITSLQGEERLAQQVAWLYAAGQSADRLALENAATRLFGEGRKAAKRRYAERQRLATLAKRAACEAIMAF